MLCSVSFYSTIYFCCDYVIIVAWLLVDLPLLDMNTHHVIMLLISVQVYSECGGVLDFTIVKCDRYILYILLRGSLVSSHPLSD
jgi:hypothetical protein